MNKAIKIIAAFVALVAFQIGWHWALTWHNSVSEVALRVYLLHNAHSQKGVAGYVDLFLPAVFIGLLMGRVGWQWPSWKFAGYVLVFAVVLVALDALYVLIISSEKAYWWPKDQNDLVPFLIRNTVETLLVLAICIYGGRLWRVEGG